MVDLRFFAPGIVLLGAGAIFAFAGGKHEQESGMVRIQEHSLPAFTRLQASVNADLRIHRAEESRLVISADSNLHELIKVRHDPKHGTVEIRTSGWKETFPRFTVDLYCPVLTEIGLAGKASVECVDPITVESFLINLAGSDSLTLRGSAETLTINLVGDGTIDGKEFKTTDISAHIVGDGKLSVWTDAMTVNITGKATVSYRGDPVLDSISMGNGRFVRIGD